jgi:hypothetical protein
MRAGWRKETAMDTPLMICVRVVEMVGEPANGSMEMRCTECNSPIWVARSSQDMLETGGGYKLICMQCAAELSKSSAVEPERDVPVSTILERLQAQAESAYDQMYDLHTDHEIRWQYELADDCLREAVKMAQDNGLAEQATKIEKRRLHIRNVYYHQFVQPPRLLM